MRAIVLGAGAGGGVPQWNCACEVCRAARAGRVRPRTQCSCAVSADGETWFLLHASPDVRAQIEATPALHPRASRDTPIAGVLLANGDLDACLGLFSLRESQPLSVHATRTVARGITEGNTISRTLARFEGHVTWRDLVLGVERPLGNGLAVTAIAAPGKAPLHLADTRAALPEDNVVLRIRDLVTSRIFVWAPCVAAPFDGLEPLLREAACVLFDGTFWTSDELARTGCGTRRAEEMGHWPVEQSLPLLSRVLGRTMLVHVNNTNPILLEDSAERRAVEAAGVEVAVDGLELVL
jgi:pyrroloquinoline quinone biosynthesis protein B